MNAFLNAILRAIDPHAAFLSHLKPPTSSFPNPVPDVLVHAKAGRWRDVGILLTTGQADINVSHLETGALIALAIRGASENIILWLLSHGASGEARDARGRSALGQAIRHCPQEVVEALLKAGASPDPKEPDGVCSPLVEALLRRHTGTAMSLLKAGARPNAEALRIVARRQASGEEGLLRRLNAFGAFSLCSHKQVEVKGAGLYAEWSIT